MWSIPVSHPKSVSHSGVLQSSRSLTEAKSSSEHLAVGNFYWRDFLATSISAEEHTNRSASLRSTFQWNPRSKISSHAPTHVDLRSDAKIHASARGGTCDTILTLASSSKCVCRLQAHPSTPHTPPLSKKPFFFTFSLRPLFLRFSVA